MTAIPWTSFTFCNPADWGFGDAEWSVLPPGLSCCDFNNMDNNPHSTCCDYSEMWDCTGPDNFTPAGTEIYCGGAFGDDLSYRGWAAGPCMCGSMAAKTLNSQSSTWQDSLDVDTTPYGWGKCGGVTNGKYCQENSDCTGESTGNECLDWTMGTNYNGDNIDLADQICEDNLYGIQEKLNGVDFSNQPNQHQGSCASGWTLLSTKLGTKGVRVGSPGIFKDSVHHVTGESYNDWWWDGQSPKSQFCDFGDPAQTLSDEDLDHAIGYQFSNQISGGTNYPHCDTETWTSREWPETGWDVSNYPEICATAGCMDTGAENYNPEAGIEDGSCIYRGCLLYCYDNPAEGFECRSYHNQPSWPAGAPCPCPFIDNNGSPMPSSYDDMVHGGDGGFQLDEMTTEQDYIDAGYIVVSSNSDNIDYWQDNNAHFDCHWCTNVNNYLGNGSCNYHDYRQCNPKIYHKYYWLGFGNPDTEFTLETGDTDSKPCCDWSMYRCPDDPTLPGYDGGEWVQADCNEPFDCQAYESWEDQYTCYTGEWDSQNGLSGYCQCSGSLDFCGVCNGSNECVGCTDPLACNYDHDATIPSQQGCGTGGCCYPEDTGHCNCFGAVDLGCGCGDPAPDECGVCNGNGETYLCWDNSLVCEAKDCPECIDEDTGCDCEDGVFPDCNGICGGDGILDDCGVCNGNNASMDDCGVCNGGNQDIDCNGDCFGDAELDYCAVCNGDNLCVGCKWESAINYNPIATVDCIPGSSMQEETNCDYCIWESCLDTETVNSTECYTFIPDAWSQPLQEPALVSVQSDVEPSEGACLSYPEWLYQEGSWLQPNPPITSNGCGTFEINNQLGLLCNQCGCMNPCDGCCTYPQCWYYDGDGDGLGCPYDASSPESQNPVVSCLSPFPANDWVSNAHSLELNLEFCSCSVNEQDLCGYCIEQFPSVLNGQENPLWNRQCCNQNGTAYCDGTLGAYPLWECNGDIRCDCDDTYCSTQGECICGYPCDTEGGISCVDNDRGFADFGSCLLRIDDCGICNGNNECIGCTDPEALNCEENYGICEPCHYGDYCNGFYNPNAYISSQCAYGGCADSASLDFNPDELVDDGSCTYQPNYQGGCWGNSSEELFPKTSSTETRVIPGDYVDIKIAFDESKNPDLLNGRQVRRVEFCIETRTDVGEMSSIYNIDNLLSSYFGETISTSPCYVDESPTKTPNGWFSGFKYDLTEEGFSAPSQIWGSGIDFWSLVYTVKVTVYDENGERIVIPQIETHDGSPYQFADAFRIVHNYDSNFSQFNQSLVYFDKTGNLIDSTYFLIPDNFNLGVTIAIAGINQNILKGDTFVLNALSSNHPEFQHLTYQWIPIDDESDYFSEFESLNSSTDYNNPVVTLTSPSDVGRIRFKLSVNEFINKLYGSGGRILNEIDCDPFAFYCIKSSDITVDKSTLIGVSPNNSTITHKIIKNIGESPNVSVPGKIGRKIDDTEFENGKTYEFSVWLRKTELRDTGATVRFGASGYYSNNWRACSLDIDLNNETISEHNTTNFGTYSNYSIVDGETSRVHIPHGGGACEKYHLYKFSDDWYKVVGQFKVSYVPGLSTTLVSDFWDYENTDTYYEFSVFPGSGTPGQLVPCNSDFDCQQIDNNSWCCSDNSIYSSNIINGDYDYCQIGLESDVVGNVYSEGHCMNSLLNYYNDDSGTSKQIYVWGMHYNEVLIGNGVGADDEVIVNVRDYDYFNIKNTKTRKPNITDEQKTLHYKKSKSKILPRIDTSKAGRSKRNEDKLLSMGYTCEQIGGCYHQ